MHLWNTLDPIQPRQDGIWNVICANDVQNSKERYSIEVIEEGIEISFNDKHPKKVELYMNFKEEWIEISINEMHPLKA